MRKSFWIYSRLMLFDKLYLFLVIFRLLDNLYTGKILILTECDKISVKWRFHKSSYQIIKFPDFTNGKSRKTESTSHCVIYRSFSTKISRNSAPGESKIESLKARLKNNAKNPTDSAQNTPQPISKPETPVLIS